MAAPIFLLRRHQIFCLTFLRCRWVAYISLRPDEVDERGGVVRASEAIDGVKYTDPTGVTIQAEVFAVTPSPDQVYEIYPLDGRDDPFTLSMKSGIPFEAAVARGLEWYVKCRQQEQI